MALAAGAIGSLLPKLHELSKEEHNRVGWVIMSLIRKLERIQDDLRRVSDDDQQVNLWAMDARNLSYRIDGLIGKLITRGPQTAIRAGDIIGSINLKLSTAKARRQFAGDIENAKRLVDEFVARHERYRIDSTIFPFRPPRSPPPDLDEQGDEEDTGVGMSTEAELDAILADADHIYKLPSWVKEGIKFLRADLQIVTVVLRKIAQVPVDELDEVTEAWVQDMRDVSRNIKRAVRHFLAGIGSPGQSRGKGYNIKPLKARLQFAIEVRDLKQCLLEVADRRRRYDLRELRVLPKRNSDDNDVAVDARLPEQLQDLESLVAVDGHRDILEHLLMPEGSTSKQQLKLVSIVGPAGVGKTTLAKAVYRILAPRFDCAAWVSLPNLPGMKAVLHDLLWQIDEQKRQHAATSSNKAQHAAPETLDAALHQAMGEAAIVAMDERDLIDKISQSLHDKRYFVVIDGIWESAAWNTMKHALVGKSNGSAVLTTSRKVDIAEYVGCVYRLVPLSKADSRKLFYKRLLHSEDNCPPALEAKSEQFIENCGGIPAAIIAMADSLASKPWTVKDWYEVHGPADYILDRGPNDTRRTLDKSYNELPDHLKPCLLYLSMFPKGCEIRGEHLVFLWIAEGFIQETQGETLQEVGQSYVKELIKRKFIKSLEVDAEGKALSCSVYDMVHDLIISKSREQNFVTVIDGRQSIYLPERVHHLSIQGNSSEQPLLQVPWPDVRTLMVYSDANLMPSLSSFRELRALDLGGCDSLQYDHLKGIENSFLLKYLVIGGSCITGLPKEIASLKLLQTLDLRASGLKELSESIVLVRHLERLYVNSHMKIPEWIGKMEALKELGDINISKPELLKELHKLTKLRVLRMAIWTWDDSYNEALLEYLCSLVQESREASGSVREPTNRPLLSRFNLLKSGLFAGTQTNPLATQLAWNQNIKSLSILTCCSLHFLDKLDAKWAPPGLQSLEIRESSFLALPKWIASLHNLSSLTIEVYKLSQEMVDILGKLQSLCSLSLTSKHAPEGKFGMVPDGFKNLTSFNFATNAMGQLFASEPKAMQILKRLQLSFKALQTEDINQGFSFGIENLCSLEHVRVEIVCFNTTRCVVENAEAAIQEAISMGRSRCPNLEIRRVRDGDMIESEEEMAVSNIKQQQKETKNKKKRLITWNQIKE
ncbi:hypothetical protein U9M48_030009 [Paspalum notatum var. saurae]|uniref:AAA+ ATPase domain-containing protein n=1 Tax=Paspalum notatum var. saurae TaxID=547442 RepID=A0AAQ3X273_PASNO